MKTKPRVRHGELRVTAVDRVAGELRVVAKILARRSTINAITIRPAEPRDSDTIANFKTASPARTFDASDDLVTENQRQLRIGQFAVDNVKIGAADRAA